jgi:hypothetical protein
VLPKDPITDATLRCCRGWHGGGSLFDELSCLLRVRHVGNMARFHFDRLSLGALRHHALLIRIDRPVFDYDEIRNINDFRFTLNFHENVVTVELSERTAGAKVPFEGAIRSN